MRFILAVACCFLAAGPASAQSVQRIAAVVNDEVISILDLEQRTRLVLFSTGIGNSQESRQRISAQVLNTLIDERLQMQEAKRLNVSVSKRDIDRGVKAIEEQNGMPEGGLKTTFERNGIAYDAILDQLRAGIAWTKLVRRRLSPRVTVGVDEAEEVISRLKATQGQDEYRLGEIVLTIDKPEQEVTIRQNAERMVEQIRDGARFSALARQFSQSATAAVGGDLGWTARSEIEPEVMAAIEGLSNGAVADPIRTISGFRILTLIGNRKIATADPNEIKVDLKQIFVPIENGTDQSAVQARIDLAKSAGGAINGCEGIATVAEKLGSEGSQDLGTLKLADLSPQIRNAVAEVEVGRASAPIRLPGGVALMVVCKRILPESSMPDSETVLDQLRNRRLDLMAQRYLRDLRAAAVIDVRV